MCAKELFGVNDFTFERIHLIFGIKMYIEILKKKLSQDRFSIFPYALVQGVQLRKRVCMY